MSRSTQFMGLNRRAINWLNKYCVSIPYVEETTRTYANGDVNTFRTEGSELVCESVVRTITGIAGEPVHDLKVYQLNNDTAGLVEEYVQCEPWSSGPMIFLALRFVDTKKPIRVSLWSDRETGQA